MQHLAGSRVHDPLKCHCVIRRVERWQSPVDRARLEIVWGNTLVGSNPTLSVLSSPLIRAEYPGLTAGNESQEIKSPAKPCKVLVSTEFQLGGKALR